jgi:hypothetical protein
MRFGKFNSFAKPLKTIKQHRIVAELDALQAEVDALKLLQAETVAELNAWRPAFKPTPRP